MGKRHAKIEDIAQMEQQAAHDKGKYVLKKSDPFEILLRIVVFIIKTRAIIRFFRLSFSSNASKRVFCFKFRTHVLYYYLGAHKTNA